jgi:hypothetical protein
MLEHRHPELCMRITRGLIAFTVSLVAACAPAHVVSTPVPVPAAGDRIRYAGRSDTTDFITARMISMDADSLVFERFIPGDPARRWVRGSLPTDSIARLQVRVARRSNPGRGALIGGIVGAAIGILCAAESSSGWLQPSPEACFMAYTVTGAGTGLLIGALRHSDVWAPTAVPRRAPPAPLVSGLSLEEAQDSARVEASPQLMPSAR